MSKKNVSSLKVVKESGTENTLVAKWTHSPVPYAARGTDKSSSSKKGTKDRRAGYKYKWQYLAGSQWYDASEGSVTKSATDLPKYQYPENATKVRVYVKIESQKYKADKKTSKETAYFTSEYVCFVYNIGTKVKPPTPEAGNISTEYYPNNKKIRVSYAVDDVTSVNHIAKVGFILFNVTDSTNNKYVYTSLTGTVNTTAKKASVVFDLEYGKAYRIRCYSIDKDGHKSCNNTKPTKNVSGAWTGWSYWNDGGSIPPSILALPSKPKNVKLIAERYSVDNRELIFSCSKSSAYVDGYSVEYSSDKRFINTDQSSKQTIDDTAKGSIFLESTISTVYYRVCAVNSLGQSEWTDIYTLSNLGRPPAAPTTWTMKTTYKVDEPIIFYWVHNSLDDSKQTKAIISLTYNTLVRDSSGEYVVVEKSQNIEYIPPTITDYDNIESTSSYEFITKDIVCEGKLTWSVKTKGASSLFSDSSIVRTINIFEDPIFTLTLSDEIIGWYWDPFNFEKDNIYSAASEIGGDTDVITKYPFYITGRTTPLSQDVLYYNVEILAKSEYSAYNDDGTPLLIKPGDVVYSKTLKPYSNDHANIVKNYLFLTIQAGDAILMNSTEYSLKVVAATNAGLTATHESTFTTQFNDDGFIIDCFQGINDETVSIDETELTASLTPYAYTETVTYTINDVEVTEDEYNEYFDHVTIETIDGTTKYYIDGVEVTEAEYNTYMNAAEAEVVDSPYQDVYMSIYRRESDGQLTLIQNRIDGHSSLTVIDPHPSLDYARYRIVGISRITGEMVYNDLPGVPVEEKSIVIQWDESWTSYDDSGIEDGAAISSAGWKGSTLKLPYNIDLSFNKTNDVETVNYIGRKHPVSYYGTHVEESGTWSFSFPKNDTETLYQIRRLASYQGDCYVREPSGTGYYAKIDLSYNINHLELIITVSMNVTRVEGGI